MTRTKLAALVLVCACAFSACFQWTEDSQGNLQSVGLPGVPIWKSSTPPPALTPTELGFTPEEAAKVGGLVLVEPPTPPARAYRYRYYSAANNNCQTDLKKLLAAREQNRKLADEEIQPLFEAYLAEITRMAEAVDKL